MTGKEIKQRVEEWFRQADYDYGTAEVLFDAGRYIYNVFMSHLALEKALKGLYLERLNREPPKTHNLDYLCTEIGLQLLEQDRPFIDEINNLCIPTRYPDGMESIYRDYKKPGVGKIMSETKRVLEWLKNESEIL